MFSKHTTGYGRGEEIEKNTFINLTCGVLKDRGMVHFYDENEIAALLEKIGFCDIQTDLIHYTDEGNVVEQIFASAKVGNKI